MRNRYQNETEIEAIVHGFESCATDKAAFRHSDHLTVAAWYLQTLGTNQTLARIRSALFRFVDHHGVDRRKYNETVTLFWVEMVAAELGKMLPATNIVEKCNRVVETLNDKDLINQYYSKETLNSEKARKEFVAPDLANWLIHKPTAQVVAGELREKS